VTAYDANQIDGRHYLVMEYVDGPNLDQLVCWQGPLPVGLACELVRQVAEALQYAHEMGLVHRDIKPSNVLVQSPRSEGRGCIAKVLDFGLARLHQRDQPAPAASNPGRKNTVLGTPDFISPEQARNVETVDIRSDLYSLGCTVYYLLTGKIPFPGGNTLEKVLRHCTEEPAPVEHHRPEVPAAVADIVRKLMAKDAGARFQIPAELAAALAPFAVPGPATWGIPRATPFADELDETTPSNSFPGLDSGLNLERDSALAGTTGMAMVTPLSASDVPFIRAQAVKPRASHWPKILVGSTCLLAALAGTAVWLLLR
jgi:serine/threonine-protein kinase